MKHFSVLAVVPALAALLIVGVVSRSRSAEKTEPQQAHMVFFTLKDHSEAAVKRFVAACHKYLSEHEGTVSFSVGTIAHDVVEPKVSVRDFDVALHLVFENKEAGAKYLVAPRHLKFVEECKESFAQVRVFDSYIVPFKH